MNMRRFAGYRVITLPLLMLCGCPSQGDDSAPVYGRIDGELYDCDNACWERGSIEVSAEYWDTWLDGTLCPDGSINIVHEGVCFSTSTLCESNWAQDPGLDDPEVCCDGVALETALDAPACTTP